MSTSSATRVSSQLIGHWSVYQCPKCGQGRLNGKVNELQIKALAEIGLLPSEAVREMIIHNYFDERKINHMLKQPGDYRFDFFSDRIQITEVPSNDCSSARRNHEKLCEEAIDFGHL